MARPRWFTDTAPDHSHWYVERFRRLAAQGEDLGGEARLVDALVVPRSRLLDAGCGSGRVGAELFSRGHEVVGVDVDPVLLEAARQDHPGPTWLEGDLTQFVLDRQVDGVVCAGNVLPYLAPGTARQALVRLRAAVAPDGVAAIGFGTDRGYSVLEFDADLAAAGWRLEHRFSTWDLRPWTTGSVFAVSLLR